MTNVRWNPLKMWVVRKLIFRQSAHWCCSRINKYRGQKNKGLQTISRLFTNMVILPGKCWWWLSDDIRDFTVFDIYLSIIYRLSSWLIIYHLSISGRIVGLCLDNRGMGHALVFSEHYLALSWVRQLAIKSLCTLKELECSSQGRWLRRLSTKDASMAAFIKFSSDEANNNWFTTMHGLC